MGDDKNVLMIMMDEHRKQSTCPDSSLSFGVFIYLFIIIRWQERFGIKIEIETTIVSSLAW